MLTTRRFVFAVLSVVPLATLRSHAAPAVVPTFAMHEIATGLRGGYQVVVADVNRDGRPDLIAVASNLSELLWFEGPTWTRHVLAGGFTGLINVAVADIDGDGFPEVAVASAFSTRPSQSAGIVSLLTHGTDVTQPWTARDIDRTPSAHRLRWYVDGDGDRWLIDSPLANTSAEAPNYDGATPIYAYHATGRAPDWKREPLPTAETGVVHAVEPIHRLFCDHCLLSAGFAGIHRYERVRGAWSVAPIASGSPAAVPQSGSSDVVAGRVPRQAGDSVFLAAIEPWHGNQLVIYRRSRAGQFERTVIDTTIVDGHTLVAADLDGDGVDEVIVGQRGGTRSVWVYSASATGWTRTTIDDGGMAAAGCAAADLNGDSRIDIVCIGTATANLRWYENLGPRRSP